MDLYLLSPPFLKRMMRRPSAEEMASLHEEEPQDSLGGVEDVALGEGLEEDLLGQDASALCVRRRSSLDRMLRQHAYIIICALCYACNTLPSQMT